jgi:hypothetical protein
MTKRFPASFIEARYYISPGTLSLKPLPYARAGIGSFSSGSLLSPLGSFAMWKSRDLNQLLPIWDQDSAFPICIMAWTTVFG